MEGSLVQNTMFAKCFGTQISGSVFLLSVNTEKDIAKDQWLGLVKGIKQHINNEVFSLKKEHRKYKNEFVKFKTSLEKSQERQDKLLDQIQE